MPTVNYVALSSRCALLCATAAAAEFAQLIRPRSLDDKSLNQSPLVNPVTSAAPKDARASKGTHASQVSLGFLAALFAAGVPCTGRTPWNGCVCPLSCIWRPQGCRPWNLFPGSTCYLESLLWPCGVLSCLTLFSTPSGVSDATAPIHLRALLAML